LLEKNIINKVVHLVSYKGSGNTSTIIRSVLNSVLEYFGQ